MPRSRTRSPAPGALLCALVALGSLLGVAAHPALATGAAPAPAPTKFAFTSAPVRGPATTSPVIGPITVTLESGSTSTVAVAPVGGTRVLLYTYSSRGSFSATLGGPTTTAVTIPAGSSSTHVYYGDLNVGSPIVVAYGSGLTPAYQHETITAPPLSVAVSGNHLVNGAGQSVRLLGVNAMGTEYACSEGWGYSEMPLTAASASAIAAWHANAVRVPLNEDCWLGINNTAANNDHQAFYGTAAGYRAAIAGWVGALNNAGLYPILDLHWSAPGTLVSDGQRALPDDHSAAFWTSVAAQFKSNKAVAFDLFNEPFSPADLGNTGLTVDWNCWRNGGCQVPSTPDTATPVPGQSYPAVGMQALVNAIRATGATQPILVGGLHYANDLSGWLAHEPTDTAHALVASFHNYDGEACGNAACWNATIAPLATHVPVVTGEFGQGYDCANPSPPPDSFDATYLSWADQHAVSYLAWTWTVLATPTPDCGSATVANGGGPGNWYSLISDYNGTPVGPDGTTLHAHLGALSGH